MFNIEVLIQFGVVYTVHIKINCIQFVCFSCFISIYLHKKWNQRIHMKTHLLKSIKLRTIPQHKRVPLKTNLLI